MAKKATDSTWPTPITTTFTAPIKKHPKGRGR
jgi:hypothetical protein